MAPPRVSVLIVSRERPEFLRACLRSVAAQNYGSRETIVLANGCPRTAELVSDEFPDVRVAVEPANLGSAGGRNAIVRASSSELLLFLDDDGELRDPTSLSSMVAAIDTDPGLGVVTIGLLDAVADEPTGWRLRQAALDRTCLHFAFAGGACLMRRAAFCEAGGYADEFTGPGEEYDLAVRLYGAGWAILHYPATAFHHHVAKGEDDWMELIHLGYAHLQTTIWRLYPAPWHLVAAAKALASAAYVDLRLGGGRRLWRVVTEGLASAGVGRRARRPIPREALRHLYFAKYHFVERTVDLERAPRTTMSRLLLWRLRRRLRGVPKLEARE